MQPRSSITPASASARHGFTVLELMLAVSLMMVIVIALYTVFDQTQRALRGTKAQVDIHEGIRATSDLMVRDLNGATPVAVADTNLTSFAVFANRYAVPVALDGVIRPPPPGALPVLETTIQDIYFVTRQNDFWKSVGYWVAPRFTNEVGTPFSVGRLYRFAYETNALDFAQVDMYRRYWDVDPQAARLAFSQPVVDGVVHLRVLAYDRFGNPLAYNERDKELFTRFSNSGNSDSLLEPRSWFIDPLREQGTAYRFRRGLHPEFPATLELEIGVLESGAATRYYAIPTPADARKFLARNAAKVHVFRHLISLRNSPSS